MPGEGDRIARAGDYVFGLMDERERACAERDLKVDPAFRNAVLRLAERMRGLGPAEPANAVSDERWRLVQRGLADLPQLRLAGLADAEARPPPIVIHRLERKPYGVGLHSLGRRLGFVIALALLAVFALGYLAGSL